MSQAAVLYRFCIVCIAAGRAASRTIFGRYRRTGKPNTNQFFQVTGVEAVCQHDRIGAARGSTAEQRKRAALIRLGAAAHRRARGKTGTEIGRPIIQTDEGITDLAQLGRATAAARRAKP
jgi:hypothetical protein